MKYQHIVSEVYRKPWAILPEKLRIITELIALRASGQVLSSDEIRERLQAAQSDRASSSRYGRSDGGELRRRLGLQLADHFRAVCALFSAAVRRVKLLQVVQRQLAARDVLSSLKRERANVLRAVGLALTQLRHAVSVENDLIGALRRQDESLLLAIEPPPFPLQADQITQWLELIGYAPPAPGDPLVSENAVQLQ